MKRDDGPSCAKASKVRADDENHQSTFRFGPNSGNETRVGEAERLFEEEFGKSLLLSSLSAR